MSQTGIKTVSIEEFLDGFEPEIPTFKANKSIKIQAPDTSTLNEKQAEAFDLTTRYALQNAIDPDGNLINCIILKGEAGTGKSYLSGMIQMAILAKREGLAWRMAVTAPTHEAISVAKDYSPFAGHPQVDFTTIQSICGLKYSFDEEEVADKFYYGETNKLEQFDLVIVDEASQLQAPGVRALFDKMIAGKLKVIFIGDPGQLPPVKSEGGISPVYDPKWHKLYFKNDPTRLKFNVHSIELTQQMRTAEGDACHKRALGVRHSPKPMRQPFIQIVKDNGLNFTEIGEESFYLYHEGNPLDGEVQEFLDLYNHPEYENRPDLIKTVCYTTGAKNPALTYWNRYIRMIRFSEEYGRDIPEFVPTEIVKFTSSLVDNTQGEPITRYGSNQEVVVESAHPTTIHTDLMEELGVVPFGAHVITTHLGKTSMMDQFTAVNPSEQKRLDKYMKSVGVMANKAKKAGNHDLKRALWSEFWAMKQNEVAWLRPAYAISAHQAQGKSYQYGLIDLRDLMRCPGFRDYRSLLYVALSRFRKGVFVLYKDKA